MSLAAAQALTAGAGAPVLVVLAAGAWDLGGAMLVGLALGVPMAYATGRVRPGEPTTAEALGVVLLCGGIALWQDVSFLVAAMVTGAVVANLARHHDCPFHVIEGIEWPFLILFFVLAGAPLQLDTLITVGSVGVVYVAARIAARFIGAGVGARLSHAPPPMRKWMGMALMPQAGVALAWLSLRESVFRRLVPRSYRLSSPPPSFSSCSVPCRRERRSPWRVK